MNVKSEDKRIKNWALGNASMKRFQRIGGGITRRSKTLPSPLYFQIVPGPPIIRFCCFYLPPISWCMRLLELWESIHTRRWSFISALWHLFVLCSVTSLLSSIWAFILMIPVSLFSHFWYSSHFLLCTSFSYIFVVTMGTAFNILKL